MLERPLEKLVLGIILNQKILIFGKHPLTVDHFQTIRNKLIFLAMVELDTEGKAITCRNLISFLRERGIDAGNEYINSLYRNKQSKKYAYPMNRCSRHFS